MDYTTDFRKYPNFSRYPEKSILGPNGKLLPEVKDAWIKALESGKYRRKVGTLFSSVNPDETKNMCCLGVLRDILSPEYFAPGRGTGIYYFSKTNSVIWGEMAVSHEGRLASINDADDTIGYSKQIKYIKENL